MLDSLIRERDKFMKPKKGSMFPSHTTMYNAPVMDKQERKSLFSLKQNTQWLTGTSLPNLPSLPMALK